MAIAGVSVRLLGRLEVRSCEGAEIAVPGRMAQAFLGYLAAHSELAEGRETLAGLFWGDRFRDQARHSLRQTVLVLRKAFEDAGAQALAADAHSVALDPAVVTVDVQRFRALAASEQRADLDEACALYRGELLADVSVRADGFTTWLDREREQLRQLAADAFMRLARLEAAEGAHDAAIAAATRALAIEPALEDCHRELMRLYRLQGNRSAALRQYQACVEALRRELDVDPDPATVRLADEIRAARDTPPPTATGGSTQPAQPSQWRTWLPSRRWRRLSPYLAGGLLLLLGAIGGVALLTGVERVRESARQERMLFPLPAQPSIVVLPFKNLNRDPAYQVMVDGMTEEITAALSMVSEMFVIARTTALTYRDRAVDVREVAEELGIRYVLDGAVQVEEDRLRVLVELVDAIENRQVWTHRYEREMTSLFEINDDITLEVVTGLQVQITEGEQDRISLVHGTDNLQAWLVAGRALQHLRRLTREDNARARGLYRQAIALDPSYPGAYDGLSWTYFIDARFGWTERPDEAIRQAGELAQRTLELDPERPATYALLGGVQLMLGNHDQAVALAEKAVELSPSGADVTAILALILTYVGDYRRSVALFQRAMRLSPSYPDWYRWSLGRAYRLLGRHRDAEATLAFEATEAGGSIAPLVELAATYAEFGKMREARQVARRVAAVAPGFSATAWTRMPPHRDQATAAAERAALIRAGLPE